MAASIFSRYTSLLLLLSATMATAAAAAASIKETNMVFYLHDLVNGTNATAFPIIGLGSKSKPNPTKFGTVVVIDDAVTMGPKRSSPQVGRAQGFYVNSNLDGSDVHLAFSIIFTNNVFNGSTLEIQGADRYVLKQREVSVVSGTGKFRFARGYAVLESVFFGNLNAVVKCNVTVRHY